MNIMQKVTWKCMHQNKKRTIVTIVGVTICVAMISAVCILVTSFQDVMIRSSIAEKGSYEGFFVIDDEDVMENIVKEDAFEKTFRLSNIATSSLTESSIAIENTYRRDLSILGMDTEHSQLGGVLLKEGRLPTKDNEIVLCEELMNDKNFIYKINNSIELLIKKDAILDADGNVIKEEQKETKTFVITGMVEVNAEMKQEPVFYAFTNFQKGENYKLFVSFVNKQTLENDMDMIAEKYDIERQDYAAHIALTYLYGTAQDGLMDVIVKACILLFLIIMIGGISLIYNAFSISLSERSRYLGMLSSVGATRKQRRNSVFFEAGVIGMISIPLGILTSILGLNITFALMNPYIEGLFGSTAVGLQVIIEGWSILLTVIFAILILFLSAWIPSRRAQRISPISAIRQNKDIKIRKYHRKKERLTRKFFGIEGELGLKNMKRNRSRYIATLTSLVICVILFMSASYFSSLVQKSYFLVQENSLFDIKLQVTQEYDSKQYIEPSKEMIKDLKNTRNAKSITTYKRMPIIYDQEVNFTKQAVDFMNKAYYAQMEGIDNLRIEPSYELIVLDDTSFDTYAKDIGASKETMSSREPSIILVNKGSYKYPNEQKYEEVEWLDISKNDHMGIQKMDAQGVLNTFVNVRVAHVSDKKIPVDASSDMEFFPTIMIVTNEENFAKLVLENQKVSDTAMFPSFNVEFTTDDDLALEQELGVIQRKYENSGVSMYIHNYSQLMRSRSQQSLLINILLYGFASLIAIVCIANIINTISTGINLRKREFAMIHSVGITPRKFQKMMMFEILSYGVKACIYGGILGVGAMYLLYLILNSTFGYPFEIPVSSNIIMIVFIFLILFCITQYALRKLKKDNIVETIRQESI
ncbi:MAG: FtsX-like permease family protein [Longicatena sp.]